MAKYEIEQLTQLKETAHVPTTFDFAEFTKSILEERERQSQQEEEFGFHGGRRRSSHQGIRPKFKTNRPKRAPAPQPDADGWVTLDKHRKSASGEEAASEKQKFKDSLKSDTQVKVRPNNKNLGSSKPVDSRDIIADHQKSTFNAFAALDGDDDDDDESEEDDE